MVLHVLKGDPMLQDLEHVPVDSLGTTYLFFYDKQGHRGLKQDVAQNLRTHVAEAFSKWVSQSAHFIVILLLLADGWQRAMAMLDRWCQRSWVEHPDHAVPCMMSSESESMLPLVGGTPPSAVQIGQLEEGGSHSLRVPSSWPRWRPPKQYPAKGGVGNSLSSSPDKDGVDSDGYSTVSEAPSSHCCRRKQHWEKQLASACLDMPIFKSTDPNADVTYTLWRFDVQGWLDQYQEESMMPHIYNSLRGYAGQWVHSLDRGPNLMVTKLLERMDHTMGNVHEYDTMIHSLYEIRQKEEESMEEYMLQIHEAIAVIHCAYPDQVTNQGKNLAWDRFYHGLAPSL